MPSVLNPWVQELTFMQQTVLLCAVRNHDGFNKHNPAKDITRYLRRVVLCSAFDGRMLADPHEGGGGNFTGPLKHKSVYNAVTAFLDGRDEMTLHYWLHAVHAFEIVGYMCPDEEIKRHFFDAYHRCVSAMHLEPESKYAMEQRLSDNPEKWLARSDAYERAAFHAEQVATGPSDGAVYAAVSQRMSDKTAVVDGVAVQLGEYVTSEGIAGDVGVSCPGAVGVPVEPHALTAIDKEERQRRPHIRDLSSEEMATRNASFSSRESADVLFEDMPIPGYASVKDGHFVNNFTGNQLGYPFDLKWGCRIDEFPVFEGTVAERAAAKQRARENGGMSDYDG